MDPHIGVAMTIALPRNRHHRGAPGKGQVGAGLGGERASFVFFGGILSFTFFCFFFGGILTFLVRSGDDDCATAQSS